MSKCEFCKIDYDSYWDICEECGQKFISSGFRRMRPVDDWPKKIRSYGIEYIRNDSKKTVEELEKFLNGWLPGRCGCCYSLGEYASHFKACYKDDEDCSYENGNVTYLTQDCQNPLHVEYNNYTDDEEAYTAKKLHEFLYGSNES